MNIVKLKFGSLFLMILGIGMVGCTTSTQEASPTLEPDKVMTAAAQTAEARLTELAKSTTTPTPLPTSTPPPPDTGATGVPATAPPEGVPTLTPSVVDMPSGTDKAAYVMDVSVPDGTKFEPGEAFTKVWRLSNAGTSTWSTSYRLAFIGGTQMSVADDVPIPISVPPGSTVDVEVEMVAPDTNGTHRSFWTMKNSAGTLFDNAVYVEIVVLSGSETKEPPPAGGGASASDLSLRVEEGHATECPYEFLFTGTFTLNKPVPVTYQLEAGSNTPGFEFTLPAPVTSNFTAGTHVVSFNLNISNSVDGWAQLHISVPNDAYSNQELFVLDCAE